MHIAASPVVPATLLDLKHPHFIKHSPYQAVSLIITWKGDVESLLATISMKL